LLPAINAPHWKRKTAWNERIDKHILNKWKWKQSGAAILISEKAIETVAKIFPTKKSPGLLNSTHLLKRSNTNAPQTFPQNTKESNTFKLNLWASIIMITK
jgi:hypothetical protein